MANKLIKKMSREGDVSLKKNELRGIAAIAEDLDADAVSVDGSFFDDTSTHASAEYSMLDGYSPPSSDDKTDTEEAEDETYAQEADINELDLLIIDSTPESFKENDKGACPSSEMYSFQASNSISPVNSVQEPDYASDREDNSVRNEEEEYYRGSVQSEYNSADDSSVDESTVGGSTVDGSGSSLDESESVGSGSDRSESVIDKSVGSEAISNVDGPDIIGATRKEKETITNHKLRNASKRFPKKTETKTSVTREDSMISKGTIKRESSVISKGSLKRNDSVISKDSIKREGSMKKNEGVEKMIQRKHIVVSKGLKRNDGKTTKKETRTKAAAKFQTGEAYHMKQTNLRVPKPRAKSKKRTPGYQLRQIRIGPPTKHGSSTEKVPGEKVMRVCKITSKGYVLAEFPTTDPNNTPLHIACLTHYSDRFILEHLLKTDSSDVTTENSDGEIPLHFAVQDRQGVHHDVMEALLSLYPGSVQHANIDGCLPIHVACQAGVPSTYSVKRLIESYPESLTVLSDTQVSIDIDSVAEPEAGCFSMAISELFFVDCNPKDEKNARYESGWSPLHLAAVHGAPPVIIEHILEVNPDCMFLKTSENRTAIECAKWVVINALVSEVSVKAFENTFAAIEIMQSYEEEMKIRDVLLIKSGLALTVLESTETFGSWWMAAAEFIPNDDDWMGDLGRSISEDSETFEKGLTPLHRAILSKSSPEKIKEILQKNPDCLEIKSAENRTALECGKSEIIAALLDGKLVASMKNTFDSLQVMQTYVNEGLNDTIKVEDLLPKSAIDKTKPGKEGEWNKAVNKYAFMKKLIANNGNSALGKSINSDNDSAVQPHGFFPPINLKHVNIRINLPSGFRRVRKAVLYHKSKFLADIVFGQKLKCQELNIGEWDKCRKVIGASHQKDGIKFDVLKGSKRNITYLLPKTHADRSEIQVHETMELLEYNDFCFVVKSIKTAPDIPHGKMFETHSQFMFIDKGVNSCRLIGSMEVKFEGLRPASAWQIKNRMRFRTTDFFKALAAGVCEHSID